ncbi:MAG: amino acid adenylation domain-containing protein [Thermoanaerobaculia bacterium]
MSASQLLAELSERGIEVWVEEDRLRVRARSGSVSEELKDRLSEHREELLALLAQSHRDATGSLHLEIEPDPASRFEPFPLTDIQQAYWVGRQQAFTLGDVSIHYYAEVLCHRLDVARLEQAWNRCIARHDMLRAVVRADGTQRVLAEVPRYAIEVRNLIGEPAAESMLALAREQLSHEVRPADQWPGFTLVVSLLDEEKSLLQVSIDLLHLDGASLLILFRDLDRFYRDPGSATAELALHYRDYVLAERAATETPQYQRSLEHWRSKLKELPPAPELPLARDIASLKGSRFRRLARRIDRPLAEALKARAAAAGLTPSAVFLTAYAEVLRAWSKNSDLTVNVTLFNRLPVHAEVNQIIGDFTSMVLLPYCPTLGQTFAERGRLLQSELWTALEHRWVSGIRVLGELAKLRGSGAGAQMPVVFTSLLDLKNQGFDLDALDAFGEVLYTVTQTPQVFLDNQVREVSDGIWVSWDAIEDLFPAAMLDDMFGAYLGLLEGLAEDSRDWSRGRFDLLPAEQKSLLAEVNRTEVPVAEETLLSLFRRQAAQTPELPAILAPGRQISYGELERRCRRLGHRLRSLGVTGEELVAVVMNKGWEQLVAALGTHAAGAAYVPVDPELPAERIRFLLADTGTRVALTQSALAAEIEWPAGLARIEVDRDDLAADAELDAPLDSALSPRSLSHVIYTSGSTGRPKGVMIEHRSVVNRMLDVNQRFGVGPGDRAFAITALHHDLSVYDIFGMLIAGGAAVLPSADQRKDPRHWVERMLEDGVTFWNSVPAFLEMLVEQLERGHAAGDPLPESLGKVILAGDWIPVSLPDRLHRLLPGVRFIASGGPTETTIWDIWNEVGEVDRGWRSIPYGKPLANARYYVLNSQLEPRPLWVAGELYIGGAGLARGYWRDAERTAEKFLEHPETGERLYKSGDWGRFLPDGKIEFLGREDAQVKISGQRIELGEIEATLAELPGVQNAVVVVRDHGGVKSLAAFVVGASAAPTPAETSLSSYGPDVAVKDTLDRLQFKLARHNLRKSPPEAQWLPLPPTLCPLDREGQAGALHSHRRFDAAPIELASFSGFLEVLSSPTVDGLPKYRYGSAGGLYPVQIYLHAKAGRISGLPGGLYYYDPRGHRLEPIAAGFELGDRLALRRQPADGRRLGLLLYFVGKLGAIEPLYGNLARDFCLIEAGMISQLLRGSAAEKGLGLCQLGWLDWSPIANALGLAGDEIYLHALLGGAELAGPVGSQAEAEAPQLAPEEELRRHLKAQLPAHMVPAAIRVVDSLPLTPNGKVDRKALAQVEPEEQEASGPLVPPRSEMETILAAIWRKVTGSERVGVETNFMELGANSLVVVKYYHEICAELAVDFPLMTMFRKPSIAQLAEVLTSETQEPTADLEVGSSRGEYRRERLRQRKKNREKPN